MNAQVRNPPRNRRLFAETLKSARIGDADAQYEVGLMYANGVGVVKDIGQAIDWITQAAKRGLARAQFLLATRYEAGIGVPQSVAKALLWFARAAEQRHAKAVFRLGKLLSKAHLEGALEQYQSAARLGVAEGQYALAKAYAEGLGVERDAAMAEHWYRAAAEQGLAAAQYAVANLLTLGPGDRVHLDEALSWYRRAAAQDHLAAKVAIELLEQAGDSPTRGTTRSKRAPAGGERRRDAARWVRAAQNGNADARYHMGLMFEQGLGLGIDLDKAMHWYHEAAQMDHVLAQACLGKLLERQGNAEAMVWYLRAAQRGDPGAQFALGRLCSSGEFAPQDYLQGLDWYGRAAAQGHTLALVTLGKICNADMHHLAACSFARAAQAGDAQAQYLLGRQYALGMEGGCDNSKAFAWYEKAAQQGLAQAESALGVAYLNGLGVASDLKLALFWLNRAAAQRDAQAQWNLGSIYASGRNGIPQDLKLAFTWCLRSANQGFVAAQANMGVLYALLKKPEEAVAWWEKAAEQDDPEALYNLAIAYLQGRGTAKKSQEGFGVLLRAAAKGVIAAQSKLGLMYATGDGVVVDPIEAHKWFAIAAGRGDEVASTNLVRSEAVCSAAQVAEAVRRARQWVANQVGC